MLAFLLAFMQSATMSSSTSALWLEAMRSAMVSSWIESGVSTLKILRTIPQELSFFSCPTGLTKPTYPQSLQGVDDAQRDRGQAGVQMDGGNKEGLCLALTPFCFLPEETRCSKTYNYPPSAPAYKERFRDV